MYIKHLDPDAQEEQAARVEYLSHLFGQCMLDAKKLPCGEYDYSEIDEYVNDCERLVGVQAHQFLEEVTVMRSEYEAFKVNINRVGNALELMTAYVEYLIENGEYA